MADDDLKRKALDAFNRSIREQGEPASAAQRPEDGAPGGRETAPPAPRSGRGSAAAGRTRHAPGVRRADAGLKRRGSPPAPAAAASASKTPAAAGSPSEQARPGRGLLWTLLAVDAVLLVLTLVLLARTDRLRDDLRKQVTLLEQIAKAADQTQAYSQVKFGVYRDSQKKLRGVYTSYANPVDCKIIELRPKE